jgi:hypothetical protein
MSDQMTYAEAAALYDELEAGAATLRSSRAGRDLFRRPRRRLTYALAACTLVAAAIILAVVISGGDGGGHPDVTAPSGNGIFGPAPAPIGSNPFAFGGRRVTVARASRLLGFEIPTPNTSLANPSNLSSTWFSPVGNGSGTRGEVMLDYVATQIQISVKPANRNLGSDARGEFRKMAKELHMSPGTLTIDGAPALVVSGGPGKPGFAEIVRGELDIAVMGHRSAAELIAVARSLYDTPAGR